MTRQSKILALPLILTLAACGGGGGGSIASAPPPIPAGPTLLRTEVSTMTPLNPTPAITTGQYDPITLVSGAGVARPGAVRIDVDTAAKTYTVTVDAGSYRPPVALFDYSQQSTFGMKVTYVDKYSDGSTKPAYINDETSGFFNAEINPNDKTRVNAFLAISGAGTSETGGRHVSLGNWGFEEAKLNTSGSYDPTGNRNSAYFAFGDRTAPGDIPASGTAQYAIENELGDGTSCDWSCLTLAGTTTLSVDFGVRRIAAENASSLSYDYYEASAGSATRVRAGTERLLTNASGSSPIGNDGGFDIALSGTGTRILERLDKSPVNPVSVPVSGTIAGAFFGPQAGEIGGVYSVPSAELYSGDLVVNQYRGAFSAVRMGP